MYKGVPNENILKLRELTGKISNNDKEDEYKVIVKQLKGIVNEGKYQISVSDCSEAKIKCYETMCTTITNLLNKIILK
jgi:hypothetical protein